MTEDNVYQQLELIKAGLDNIDQGITIFDKNFELVFANKTLAHLLDLPENFLKPGTRFEDLIRYNCERGDYGPGDPEQQLIERSSIAKQYKPHLIERERPDGSVIRVSGSPLPGGGFATIYTDYTKERRHEVMQKQLIDEQTVTLSKSEERLRLIADEVPAGIAYLDQDEVFQFVNRRFARAYGKTPSEVVGQHSQSILSSDTYLNVRQDFMKASAGEKVDFDMTIAFEDRRKADIRTFLRPNFENNIVVGFYVLSINVTQHTRAAAALSQAQKMEAIGRLSSGIAHDFNNLLTIILGNLQPLSEQIEDQTQLEQMVEPSIRAARRGADLTKQLLTVARRQSLKEKPVKISEIITSIAQLIKPSLSENIKLTTILTNTDISALVDQAQLENALLNLALNARDAIERSGEITLELDLFSPENHGRSDKVLVAEKQVRIRVKDTGKGIPPGIIKMIFDPFFSTKENEGGSGLGLTMAQSFVEQSKGSIAVHSKPNQGTEFTILLPISNSQASAQENIEADKISASSSKVVLLVDDDHEVRKVIRRDLVSLDCVVLEAIDAEEALQLIHRVEGINTLLSDIAMPGTMSGIELAASVQKTHPQIAIVLMTGHGDTKAQRSELTYDYELLRKPFDQPMLASALSNAPNCS